MCSGSMPTSLAAAPPVPEILIDISRTFYTRLISRIPAGIDRVGLEYIRHYGELARAVFTVGPFSSVLSHADSDRAFRFLLNRDGNPWPMGARLAFSGYASWWRGARNSRCILLNTGNFWQKNPHYAGGLVRKGARPVFFVHDVLPITHPEFFPPGEAERHRQRMQTIFVTAKGIIVNSNHTMNELRMFAERQSVRLPPTSVALLGSNLRLGSPGPRPIEERYFVILGTIEPRKNHWLMLQLWGSLVEKLGDDAPKLVIIGQRGWECENVVDMLERSQRVRGFVIERNRCTDAELVTWLHHAQALLFPSFAEGYGMPLNEALSLGVPVIASDLPVFREIAYEIPDYAGALDGQRWLELIADFSSGASVRRAAQIARMKDFHPLSWEQHFKVVDEFLEQLDAENS